MITFILGNTAPLRNKISKIDRNSTCLQPINDIAITTGEIKLVEFLPCYRYHSIGLFTIEDRDEALKCCFPGSISSTNIGMLIKLNFNNTRQVSVYKNDTKQLWHDTSLNIK